VKNSLNKGDQSRIIDAQERKRETRDAVEDAWENVRVGVENKWDSRKEACKQVAAHGVIDPSAPGG